LQFILSLFNSLAAYIPSQVLAILIKILSLGISASSYSFMIFFALFTVACLSKLNLASTSEDTNPGINESIFAPNTVINLSQASSISAFYSATESASNSISNSLSSSILFSSAT